MATQRHYAAATLLLMLAAEGDDGYCRHTLLLLRCWRRRTDATLRVMLQAMPFTLHTLRYVELCCYDTHCYALW